MPDKPDGNAPADSAKDKFRQALERKKERSHANNGDAANDSKVHGQHDRAGSKRTFRRKSG